MKVEELCADSFFVLLLETVPSPVFRKCRDGNIIQLFSKRWRKPHPGIKNDDVVVEIDGLKSFLFGIEGYVD